MFTHKLDSTISLRPFNIKDAEEFYQLTINSKEHFKNGWVVRLCAKGRRYRKNNY